jgi:hypothetical protein
MYAATLYCYTELTELTGKVGQGSWQTQDTFRLCTLPLVWQMYIMAAVRQSSHVTSRGIDTFPAFEDKLKFFNSSFGYSYNPPGI